MNIQNAPATYPLTPSQLQLWAGQQVALECPLYNMALAWSLCGDLDSVRLQSAWTAVQRDFPSVNTRITLSDGEPVQYCSDRISDFELIDLSTRPNAEANTWEVLQNETKKPFAIDGCLVKAILVALPANKWVWYLKAHHLIVDAWSFKSLWTRLADHYFSDIHSPPTESKPLTQYRDYVTFLNRRLNTLMPNSDEETTWAQRSPLVPVTLHRDENKKPTTRSIRLDSPFSEARYQALNNLAARGDARSFSEDLSRYTVLLTVLFAYLGRMSGDSELTVGSPLPNRSAREFSHTPGLFVEVLPLRVEYTDGMTFNALLTEVRREVFHYLKYGKPGSCTFVKAANINAIFNYINAPLEQFGDLATSVKWLHSGHADSSHALRVQITDWSASGEPQLAFDFNQTYYTDVQRTDTHNHWWALFDAMHADPDVPIGKVSLVERTEQAVMSESAIPHSPKPSSNELILSRFAKTALDNADRPAVTDNECSYTYAEIANLSDRIAVGLKNTGVSEGSRVGIYMRRSSALVTSILGVMKSGAAYVPFDASNPVDRVHFLINDARLDSVIADNDLASRLPPTPEICLFNDLVSAPATTTAEIADFSEQLQADSTAYIMYTSGSTGQPKGVVISHSALANYLNWAAEFYCSDSPMSFPLFTPIGFDLTVTSLFVPLIVGGQIHVYSESPTGGDLALLDVLNDNAVDIIKLTPSHLALLQTHSLKDSKVKQLILGGENLQRDLAYRIHQAFNGAVTIHNEYGPTESTVGCIVHSYDPTVDCAESVPIGKPVSGVSAFVMNDHGQIQPQGVVGELYLAGDSLANGYWQRPGLSALFFGEFDELTRQRLYRTGDLVRLNNKAELQYLGRRDEQLKIRGARIEVAEIEASCLANVNITSCHVSITGQEDDEHEVPEQFCVRCGLSSRYPDACISTEGVCELCQRFEMYESRANAWFKTTAELEAIVANIQQRNAGKFDCIVLLSGGKDSSYALARLVDMGLTVLAFTLDNGYISEQAKDNIDRVCKALNVEHRYGQTPAMNEIFTDSLKRHSNVCHGCFKVLYTLSLSLAQQLDISTIFTGLSRGQFFETRLTEELFTRPVFDIKSIDEAVLDSRKTYHRVDDAVAKCMDVSHVADGKIFDEISIIDFYRYCSVNLDEMYTYLEQRLPWIRPSDTGRSTNCLINDVGIYVHKKERGYHNYALPYSWDVRLGHKERTAALEELDDALDETYIAKVLVELGYHSEDSAAESNNQIALYYVCQDEHTTPVEVRQQLAKKLPAWMMPSHFIPITEMPLSSNGKVLRAALPKPGTQREGSGAEYRPPGNDREILLATIWREMLRLDSIGIDDNYFELGGDSLTAIRIIARVNQSGFHCTVADLFDNQSVAQLASVIGEESQESVNAGANVGSAFDTLKPGQLVKLANLLRKPGENDTEAQGT